MYISRYSTLKTMNLSKEKKTKMLLDYAKECYKEGHKPTKKEIRREFHLEIYNYFEDIADYHRKAGIPVSIRNYPKIKARNLIIEYLKSSAKEKKYPNCKEIEKAMGINFSTYFNNLKDLYDTANVLFSLVEKEIKYKILNSHTHDEETLKQQKKLVQDLIKQKVENGFYPGVSYIQKHLFLSFYNLYDNILEAYDDAAVSYARPSPILLGKRKEIELTKIIKKLLVKMGFTINRVSIESETSFNKHADMTVTDDKGERHLIEIKAYRKDYSITNREFGQLIKYLKKERISKGIFITTSNTKKCKFGDIEFINGDKLIQLLKLHGLSSHLKVIRWIQRSRINSKEREDHQKIMKNKIRDYASSKKMFPTKRKIEKHFRIDIRSVFGEPNPYKILLKEIKI